VLIHAGASGVGTSLIQLAKAIGAKSIVTAGSEEKIKYCVDLGASAGINYKTTPNFSERVLELTDGQGVDLVLDCVGASYFHQNLASAKAEGIWVLYGTMGGVDVENVNLRDILRKRITLTATTIRARSVAYKADVVRCFKEFGAIEKFANKTFVPIIDTMFPLDEIVEAHRRLESNATIGKIVLQVSSFC
jgi:NADPH:quinone reductase-like Zn-dependent oxidoreductase